MMQTRDRVNWNTLGKGWGAAYLPNSTAEVGTCLPARCIFHVLRHGVLQTRNLATTSMLPHWRTQERPCKQLSIPYVLVAVSGRLLIPPGNPVLLPTPTFFSLSMSSASFVEGGFSTVALSLSILVTNLESQPASQTSSQAARHASSSQSYCLPLANMHIHVDIYSVIHAQIYIHLGVSPRSGHRLNNSIKGERRSHFAGAMAILQNGSSFNMHLH